MAAPESAAPDAPTTGGAAVAEGGFAASDTGRVEAFSDAVIAIAITILVLELRSPPHEPGHLLAALAHQWPVYVGYLMSFAYIGVIWLNHHQAFLRIRAVDRGLHLANLALLFTTAGLSFPTAVVSDALQENLAGDDARTAVALYALIAAAMCASWLWIYHHLDRYPALKSPRCEVDYVHQGFVRSLSGLVAYLVGGAAGFLIHPAIALAVYVLLPIFYFATTEGLRLRLRAPSPVAPH
ncbi:TMEM175 family protein [Amycolatopsis sp. NPDC051903]|uniref:TMEM175 family protein n=1 Tax=Amycolatopsis sp. NPDC051903 TaxID=3363936 RepID=UPI0037B73BFF